MKIILAHLHGLPQELKSLSYGDVTRDDLQQQFLVQHSIGKLEPCKIVVANYLVSHHFKVRKDTPNHYKEGNKLM